MSDFIPAPTLPHNCLAVLPWERGGYGSTGDETGALRRCPECGRWWVSRPCYESFGPTSHWLPVRWYHFGLRRRIDAALSMLGEA